MKVLCAMKHNRTTAPQDHLIFIQLSATLAIYSCLSFFFFWI